MGKRIISQARGKGGPRYASPSHRYIGKIVYRNYDDKEKAGVNYGKVIDIIDCPGHSAPLLKIKYDDGEECLIAAPKNIKLGAVTASGSTASIENGNIVPLKNLTEGATICNIEFSPGSGPVFCRASGSFARVVGKTDNKVVIKFSSNKTKELDLDCRATIGIVAGGGRTEKPFVKAGNKYHAMAARNKLYPLTSAVAMNVTDHPFGSGRGRHKGKPSVPPRNAPPGRNVGLIRARRTGHQK